MQFRTTNFVPTRRRGTMKLGLLLATIAAACLLAAPSMQAQRYLGGISGTVSDQTGAILPGAQVLAVEQSTQFKTEVVTSADGAYSMPTLSPGTYEVTVTVKGFKTETRANVVLTAGQVVLLDFKLSPGNVSQTVEVVSETASLIDTGSPTIATTLDSQEVSDLPNKGRNPYVLATLTPGVVDTALGRLLRRPFEPVHQSLQRRRGADYYVRHVRTQPPDAEWHPRRRAGTLLGRYLPRLHSFARCGAGDQG